MTFWVISGVKTEKQYTLYCLPKI